MHTIITFIITLPIFFVNKKVFGRLIQVEKSSALVLILIRYDTRASDNFNLLSPFRAGNLLNEESDRPNRKQLLGNINPKYKNTERFSQLIMSAALSIRVFCSLKLILLGIRVNFSFLMNCDKFFSALIMIVHVLLSRSISQLKLSLDNPFLRVRRSQMHFEYIQLLDNVLITIQSKQS